MKENEFQARVDKALETLPTPEAVIEWAKANNFSFKGGSLGAADCGCALTAVVLMGYPEFFSEGMLVEWSSETLHHYIDVENALWGTVYGDGTPLNRIRQGIWQGFDGLTCAGGNQAAFKFGSELRRLVNMNNLWKKDN